jgi:hypothetical protein
MPLNNPKIVYHGLSILASVSWSPYVNQEFPNLGVTCDQRKSKEVSLGTETELQT